MKISTEANSTQHERSGLGALSISSSFREGWRRNFASTAAALAVSTSAALQNSSANAAAVASPNARDTFQGGGSQNGNPYVLNYNEAPFYPGLRQAIDFNRSAEWGPVPVQSIEIHPLKGLSDNSGKTEVKVGDTPQYYHGFYIAFREGRSRTDGLPKSVIRRNEKNGSVTLTFATELTSDNLLKRVRQIIREDPQEQARVAKIPFEQIDVRAMPITDMYIRCVDRYCPYQTILATGYTNRVIANSPEFNVVLTPEMEERFKEAHAEGGLAFQFAYRINGVTVASGSRVDYGQLNISQELEQEFNSQQREGRVPVLRNDISNFVRKVDGKIRTEIRGNDRGVVELLVSAGRNAWMDQIFSSEAALPIHELARLYPEVLERLAAYFEPQLIQVQSSLAKKGIQVELKQSGSGSESGKAASVGLGANFYGVKIGGSGALSQAEVKEVIESIERTTGVRTEYSKSENSFKPHSIMIRFLNRGAQEINLDNVAQVSIQLPSQDGYLTSALIPSDFVVSEARKILGTAQTIHDQIKALKLANSAFARANLEQKDQIATLQTQNTNLEKKLEDAGKALVAEKERVGRRNTTIAGKNNVIATHKKTIEDKDALIAQLSKHKQNLDTIKEIFSAPKTHFRSYDARQKWVESAAKTIKQLLGCSEVFAKRLAEVANQRHTHPASPRDPSDQMRN